MNLTPLTTLTWAYQLHYYLCFRTHRRRELFSSQLCANSLAEFIREISTNHSYHLLEQNQYPAQLRCLLSMQPSQTVAKAVQLLKCNSSRELARMFGLWFPFGPEVTWPGAVAVCGLPQFVHILISKPLTMDTLLEFCRRSIGIESHTREICVRRMPHSI